MYGYDMKSATPGQRCRRYTYRSVQVIGNVDLLCLENPALALVGYPT